MSQHCKHHKGQVVKTRTVTVIPDNRKVETIWCPRCEAFPPEGTPMPKVERTA